MASGAGSINTEISSPSMATSSSGGIYLAPVNINPLSPEQNNYALYIILAGAITLGILFIKRKK